MLNVLCALPHLTLFQEHKSPTLLRLQTVNKSDITALKLKGIRKSRVMYSKHIRLRGQEKNGKQMLPIHNNAKTSTHSLPADIVKSVSVLVNERTSIRAITTDDSHRNNRVTAEIPQHFFCIARHRRSQSFKNGGYTIPGGGGSEGYYRRGFGGFPLDFF